MSDGNEKKQSRLSVFLKDKKTGKLRTDIIVALGLAGILLIFISGLDPGNKDDDTPVSTAYDMSYADSYAKQKESDLCAILSSISGCGNVEVMISVEGTEEYVYLKNSDSRTSTGAEGVFSTESKSDIVLSNKSEPVLVKTLSPKITGVLIVADGAGEPVLDEKLIMSAAAALGISSANIRVAKRCK